MLGLNTATRRIYLASYKKHFRRQNSKFSKLHVQIKKCLLLADDRNCWTVLTLIIVWHWVYLILWFKWRSKLLVLLTRGVSIVENRLRGRLFAKLVAVVQLELIMFYEESIGLGNLDIFFIPSIIVHCNKLNKNYYLLITWSSISTQFLSLDTKLLHQMIYL